MSDLSDRIGKIKNSLAIAEYSEAQYKGALEETSKTFYDKYNSLSDEAKVVIRENFPSLCRLSKDELNNLSYDEMAKLRGEIEENLNLMLSNLERELKC